MTGALVAALFAALAVSPHVSKAAENDELVGGYLKVAGPAGCDGPSPSCRAPYGPREVSALATSPDGQSVYVRVYGFGRLEDDPDVLVAARREADGLLRFPGGACLQGRDGCTLLGADPELLDVAVSPDGEVIYALTTHSLLRIRVDPSGALGSPDAQFRLLEPSGQFSALALTPDGRRIYAGVTDDRDLDAGGLLA